LQNFLSMNKKTNIIFIIFIILFVSQRINASSDKNGNRESETENPRPKFIYQLDNLTYFDNRMFYLPYHPSKMFFGDRFTALCGIGINKDGYHKLYAGLTSMLPFGTELNNYKYQPMIYYKYQQDFDNQKLKLHFGILPYREIEMSLPGYIRRGSAEYTVPNLQGALAQYKLSINEKTALAVEYLVDWRKTKTKTERDNFEMILIGKLTINKIIDFIMLLI